MIRNSFNGIGRITKEPELRTVGEKNVLDFTIAITRPFAKKDHPESDFIDCTAWGSTADNITKFFGKGDRIGVSGRVEVKPYEDKDGVKRKSFKVIVDDFEFIENKKDRATSTEDSSDTEEVKDNSTDNDSDNDKDLPF